MPVVCHCAVVVCGGEGCAVKRLAAAVAEECGQRLNPHNPADLRCLLREFYQRTSAEHEARTGLPPEQRCRTCEGNITQEFINDYDGKACLDGIGFPPP